MQATSLHVKVEIRLAASAVGQGKESRVKEVLVHAPTGSVKTWITCLHPTKTWKVWVQQHNMYTAMKNQHPSSEVLETTDSKKLIVPPPQQLHIAGGY